MRGRYDDMLESAGVECVLSYKVSRNANRGRHGVRSYRRGCVSFVGR